MQSIYFHTDGGACLWKMVCHTDNGSSYPLKSDTVFSINENREAEADPLPAIQHCRSGMVNFIHSPHSLPVINENSLIWWQRGVAVLKCDNGALLLAVEPESASWTILEPPFDAFFMTLKEPHPLHQILACSSMSLDYAVRFIQDCLRQNLLAVESWPLLCECSYPSALPFEGHYIIELSRPYPCEGRELRERMSLSVLEKTIEGIFSRPGDFPAEMTLIYEGPEDLALLENAVSLSEEGMKRGQLMNLAIKAPVDIIDDALAQYCASKSISVKVVVRTPGSHHSIVGNPYSSKALEMQERAVKKLSSLGVLKYGIFEAGSPEDLQLPESLILQQVISDVRLDFIPAFNEEDTDRAALLADALLDMAESLLEKKKEGELLHLPELHPLSNYLYNLSTSPFRNALCAEYYSHPEGRAVRFETGGRRIDCSACVKEADGISFRDRCSSLYRLECRHCLWRNFCVRRCSLMDLHVSEEQNLLHCRMNTLLIPRLMHRLSRQSGLLQFVHRGRYK
ncbi:MAG: hypothetical protein AB9903_31875 [Vulcanimicrobiota bacterium]